MKRVRTLVALPLAALAMLAASTAISPEAAAQTTPAPKPTTAPAAPAPAAKPAAPAPAAKPAGATTAPRAGGIPLEMAGALVAGGSALIGGGFYALRRRKRQA
jgi:LPXTG-motif cell wall-anchored protein